TREACTVEFASGEASLKRTVRYVSVEDAWRITDEVAGEQAHVVRWRLPPTWQPASRSAQGLTVVRATGTAVQLRIESDELIAVDVSDDLVSPHYGLFERGTVISAMFKKRLTSQWQRLTPSRDR